MLNLGLQQGNFVLQCTDAILRTSKLFCGGATGQAGDNESSHSELKYLFHASSLCLVYQ